MFFCPTASRRRVHRSSVDYYTLVGGHQRTSGDCCVAMFEPLPIYMFLIPARPPGAAAITLIAGSVEEGSRSYRDRDRARGVRATARSRQRLPYAERIQRGPALVSAAPGKAGSCEGGEMGVWCGNFSVFIDSVVSIFRFLFLAAYFVIGESLLFFCRRGVRLREGVEY